MPLLLFVFLFFKILQKIIFPYSANKFIKSFSVILYLILIINNSLFAWLDIKLKHNSGSSKEHSGKSKSYILSFLNSFLYLLKFLL